MKELFAISFFFTGISLFGMFMMMDDFIALWIGSKYILGNRILILFLVNFFIRQQTGIVEMFINGFGLFSDIYAPAAESLIFLPAAIIGGIFWGQAGVILGGVVSRCIIWQLWKPYFLFKCGFQMPIWIYWRFWFRHVVVQVFAYSISWTLFTFFRSSLPSGLLGFILGALLSATIYAVVSGFLMYYITEGTRECFIRLQKRFCCWRLYPKNSA